MEKELIYISGPISGRDLTERRKTFAATAAKLQAMGYDVCNPMENGHRHCRQVQIAFTIYHPDHTNLS